MYDVIIIGAGPAGITAGIYCKRANLNTIIFEKDTIGGQIASSPLVENFPSIKSISGTELANNLYEQAESLEIPIEIEEVLKIKPGKIKTVVTEYGEYQAHAVILATGSKYRLLGLPNEEDFIGKGISFCTSCDGAFYKDKDVAVIGGANTAVTNALYLSNICNKVYLIYRGDKLKAEKVLIDKLSTKTNLEVFYNTNVIALFGNDELENIKIKDKQAEKTLNVSGMFLSIGMTAQTDIAKDILTLNEQNYILSTDCNTNEEGIFVAGDCRTKELRQLTTAMSDGAIAATNAIKYIENNK